MGNELDAVAADLHPPSPGACGDDCACLASTPRQPLAMLPAAIADACTLDRASAEERLRAWSAVASGAASRKNIDGGLRLSLADETDLGEVACLAAAESMCCPMFEFQITVDGRGRA